TRSPPRNRGAVVAISNSWEVWAPASSPSSSSKTTKWQKRSAAKEHGPSSAETTSAATTPEARPNVSEAGRRASPRGHSQTSPTTVRSETEATAQVSQLPPPAVVAQQSVEVGGTRFHGGRR